MILDTLETNSNSSNKLRSYQNFQNYSIRVNYVIFMFISMANSHDTGKSKLVETGIVTAGLSFFSFVKISLAKPITSLVLIPID